MNKIYQFLIVFNIGLTSLQAQTNSETQIKSVFNQLVTAYCSPKSAPNLTFIKTNPNPTTPAFYKEKSITIDLRFYKLCQTFGKDSLNALSIVISHELAHYYYEHDFCSDFAYAIKNKSDKFSKDLKLINKNQKVIYETQADDKGLFYAAIAGFSPFEVQPKIIDGIYQFYQLKDINVGYPTKTERKIIAQNALAKSQKLFILFKQAKEAKEKKEYDKALLLFESVNQDFPSRENYNNIGVIKTLQALELKAPTYEEKKAPKRFLYPLEIDNSSRLKREITRGDVDNSDKFEALLKAAQKDFEKAISLDPNYTISYINLACVFDLLENPEAAIGKIKELTKDKQETVDAKRILAIAYYHANMEQKANEIWQNLKI